jgi:tetratricopeptide (TPR) repeat protein
MERIDRFNFVQLNPKNDLAWGVLGRAFAKNDQPNEAIDAYAEAVRLNPKDAKICLSLAYLHNEVKKYNAAIEACNKALQINPKSPEAMTIKGESFLYIGLLNNADISFQEAIRLNPEYAWAWYRKGIVHTYRQSPREVRNVYERLKILNPKLADQFSEQVMLPFLQQTQ